MTIPRLRQTKPQFLGQKGKTFPFAALEARSPTASHSILTP
jgi:hypothetical protein